MNDFYVKTCPSCGAEENPFYTAGGENDTPFGLVFAAAKENDGSFTPIMNKSFPVVPIICVNCNHVMLFKAN